MFKSKLKSLARLKKGSMGNSCAASPSPESGEEKQRDREKKKLTISAPISLEEFKAQQDRSQEDVSDLPTHHALDLTSPKDEEPSIEETMGEEQQAEPSTYQNQHELEPPEEDEEGGEEEQEEEEIEERGSSGMGTDDESLPELFEPSSPLQIGSNFLLPDIMEESENERSESLRSSLLSSDGMIIKSPSKQKFTKFDPFEETGLDVVETNFDSDVPLPVNDDNCDDEQASDASGSPVDPPILPVSPPPGPLLSPRYSMMLLESSEQDDHNRFSIVSVSSEMAPPLPTSLPPGKLIPRESLLYQDPESKIDLWYELMRTNEEKVHSGDSTSHEELKADTNHDPIIKSEEAETSHKFIEHLSTSDSGFPDTDMTTDHSTGGRNIDTPIGNPHQFISVATKNSSTSIASCSDERTTEYSGSIGLKTNFSSGSQHSPSEAESHENDDANSMSTKIGDCEQNEGEPHVHPPPAIIRSPPISPEQGETIKPSIRKTGWLEVKTVLVRKNRKVAMASKRKWKKYWATLKGSFLLFYQCDDSIMEYDLPELKLDLELSLAHTVHDHVKRDHIFCLSTNNGNTYYMQTISQSEVDDWITTIHCAAATMLSGHHNKEDAIAVLKDKVQELSGDIEKEKKLRNLTELAATNSDIKSMASDQLIVCSENIEKYKLNLYRVRCYIASLEGNELPNPQSLLASVSKPTKLALGRVGMFSVASLNAIVCSRTGMVTSSSSWSLRPKLSIPSSPSAIFRTKSKNDSPKSPKGSESTKTSKRGLEISGPILKVSPNSSPASTSKLTARDRSRSLPRSPKSRRPLEIFRQLSPQPSPSSRSKLISLPKRTQERKLSTPDLRSKDISGPYPIVISPTSLVTLSPTFTPKSGQFDQQEITNMEENVDSPAGVPVSSTGSAPVQADYNGDKVNIIDDKGVHELEQKELQDLTDSALRLVITVRSKSYPGSSLSPTPPILETLICPAPPSHQTEITGEHLLRLTVPRPGSESSEGTLMEPPSPSITQDQIDLLLNDSREVSKLIDVWEMSQPPPVHTAWTRLDKLRKSATDLVETESEYVMNLEILTKRYLEPLERESVLPLNDVNTLVGNIPDILSKQRTFLKRLEDSLELERDHPEALDEDNKLKQVVIGVSRALVEYAAEHFREYGTFCSSRQKIKQILAHEGNEQLRQFLEARNPERDTSLNIEVLLAKPMVRISRYPLFINAMMDNTLPDSEEKEHLKDALEAMTRVADYINEVQRLCETYGTVLDSFLRDQALPEHGVSLKVSQLKNQSEVMWLNPADEHLAKGWKKGQGPTTACLVFDASIVLFCLNKKLKRKENKVVQELAVAEDEIRFKMLLPCAKCSIYDLPDSDGVTNMWRLQYNSNSNFDKCVDYLLRSQSAQQKSLTIQAIRQCIHQQPQRLHWDLSQGTKVKAASTSALPSLDRQTSYNLSTIAESSTDSHNHHNTSHSSLPS